MISFTSEPSKENIEAAAHFGIPIYYINRNKYKMKKPNNENSLKEIVFSDDNPLPIIEKNTKKSCK